MIVDSENRKKAILDWELRVLKEVDKQRENFQDSQQLQAQRMKFLGSSVITHN
jgi:hypothetical protein